MKMGKKLSASRGLYPANPSRSSATGPHWGSPPTQTPVIGSSSVLAMVRLPLAKILDPPLVIGDNSTEASAS